MSVRSTLDRFWLPASLALNVFLATTLVWHAVPRHPPHHPPGGPGHFFVDVVARHLPAADADLVRRNFAAHEAEMQAGEAASQEASRRIAALIDSDTVDPAILREALNAGISAHHALDQKVTEILVDTIVHLSREGRHSFVLAMQPGGHPPDGGPPPDGPDGPPPDGPPPPDEGR